MGKSSGDIETMVAGDRLPKELQDRVVETYEIPLVGRVEIRQDPRTNQYGGWVSGWGLVNVETPTDLTATRNFVGEFAASLAKGRFEDAKKAYQEIARPYSELLFHVGTSAKEGKDWMQKYRESAPSK
ncbi:hypothetical protein FJZ17_03075 [Candidatus Pacearchaeota archaeon]|nr:hypothetical protein [Candidatus Pacearchaeota archaeon]